MVRMTRRGKRRLFALLAILSVGTIIVVAFSALRSAQEARMLASLREAGMTAYEQGNLEGTLRDLSYVFEYDKNDLQVNLTFAEARMRVPIPGGRHLWEAVDLYSNHCMRLLRSDEAQVLDPDGSKRALVLDRMLDLYCQLGLPFEVIQAADGLLKIDSDHVAALSAKSEALCMQREFTAAAPLAARLVELEPNNLKWRRLVLEIQRENGFSADQRLEQGRVWAAERQGSGSDGRFHLLTAAMLLDMNRVDEAIAELQAASEQSADEREVLATAVEMLDVLDERRESESLIASTIEKWPDHVWPREVAIRRLWHANRIEECLSEIQSARDALPVVSAAIEKLHVLTLISSRRIDEARTALTPLLRLSQQVQQNDADRAWAQAVQAALDTNVSWTLRKEALSKALALSPSDASLHSLMGDVWSEVGELSQAIHYYQRASALDPEWLAAGVTFTNALWRVGRLEEAYATSRLVISRAELGQLEPLLLFARVYLALNGTGWAFDSSQGLEELGGDLLSILKQLHAQSFGQPHDARIIGLCAEAIVQFEGADIATEFIMNSLQTSPMQVENLLALGEVVLRHELDAADLLMETAQRLHPMPVELAVILAEFQVRQGDVAQGLQLIDNALQTTLTSDNAVESARMRAEFMLRHNVPGTIEHLRSLIARFSDSIPVQQLVLSQPQAWSDRPLVEQALANLVVILGEHSQQVRLAEANFLLRNSADHGSREGLARAIRQIESVLQQSPDSLAALSLMAEAVMRANPPNIDRAIACLERASNLYPAESTLIGRLVGLLQRRGEFGKAGQYLRVMAAIAQKRPQLQRMELRLWQHQGDFEAALIRAAAIVNEQSPASDQLVFAAICQRAGRNDEAERVYGRLLESSPENALVRTEAAEFYAATGRFEKGVALLEDLSGIPETSVDADLILGAFHQRHDHVKEAGEYLHRSLRNRPDSADTRRELAWHYLALKDRAAAADHALQGLQQDVDNAALHRVLAVAAIGLSAHERTGILQRLKQLESRRPSDEQSSPNESLQALIDTVTFLNLVPLRDEKYQPSPDQLATVRRMLDDTNSSVSRFLPAWQAAIQLFNDADRTNESIAIARSAISRFPGQIEPTQWATQLLVAAGRSREALAEAQEWRRRSLLSGADALQPDVVAASILLDLGRPEEAAGHIKKYAVQFWNARQEHPDRLGVWVRSQALSAERVDEGEFHSQLQTLFKEDARWRHMWLSLIGQMDDRRARVSLLLLHDFIIEPKEHLAVAAEWTMLGKSTGASDCFDHAQTLAVKLGEGRGLELESIMMQGSIAEARRNWTEAEAHYRNALSRNPDNAIALNNLAFVLTHHKESCEEAIALIDRALGIVPDQPDFLETKARALMGVGRFAQAHEVMQRASQLRPNDLGIALTLLEVQFQHDADESDVQSLADLQQRIRMEKRPDPDLQTRIDELWQRFQQSRADPAL